MGNRRRYTYGREQFDYLSLHELAAKLVEEYGAIIRTEYHMQIVCNKGYHDIWCGRKGLKWRLYGCQMTDYGSPERLLAALASYAPESTDLARMQQLTAFLKRVEGRVGVFVDAGWKNGQAKAAAICSFGDGDCDVLVRSFQADNAEHAELKIIELAHSRFEGPIYSDCQGAVAKYGPPAAWIPRENNREADVIGNMRDL